MSAVIPGLWEEEIIVNSRTTKTLVTQHCPGKLVKLSTTFFKKKTDGTGKMSGSIDVDSNDVSKVKTVSSVPNQDITISGNVDL